MQTTQDTQFLQALATQSVADSVFGANSELQAVALQTPPRRVIDGQQVNELMLDGLAVLLFGLYCIQLFVHRSSIGLLFRALTVKGQFSQLIDEQSVAFRSFVKSFRIIGFLALLTIAFKGCLIWANSPSVFRLPEAYLPFLLPILTAALLAIGWYRRLVTGTLSVLSGEAERVERLRTFDRICFVVAALLVTPAVLLSALADPATHRFLFVVDVILLIILLLYYLGKSFSFFISRKISILQWILYLCAVEIMPISFFVLFAGRGFEW
ncbi:MAG: DUF4271 domain-containing protein [Rikenellaceae bacterium]|jgi:hypothetical protein|nr:DUF4271 domain-containing protein [Rikenellaceae bacterium]